MKKIYYFYAIDYRYIINKKNIFIMKKTLLLLIFPLLFSASHVDAQIKVWDFGADPLGTGFTNMITVANQTTCGLFTAGSLTYGTASNSVQTLTASHAFGELTINTLAGDRWRSDNTDLVLYDTQLNNTFNTIGVTPVFTGAVKSGRLAFNGTGNATRRYYTMTLAAGQTMTIYWKSNLITAGNLTVIPPSGSAVAATSAYPAVSGTPDFKTTKITADVAGAYTIGDYTGKMETYRIYLADVNAGIYSLSNSNFEGGLSLDVFSVKNQVYVTNIASETQVNVYSMTGALVKSLSTSSDINFDLNSGFYIVNVKSAEGQKSVKVLVK